MSRETKKIIAGCAFGAAGFLLYAAAKVFGGMAQCYSTHIYPILVSSIGRLFGLFPFSVSEICIYLLVIILCVTAVRLAAGACLKKLKKGAVKKSLCSLFLLAGVLWFLYVINCGINYGRISFSRSAGIQTKEYTIGELKEVCSWLTKQVNARASEVKRDADGTMLLGEEVAENGVDVMEALGEKYPQMEGFYPRPKGFIFPWVLSVQNLTGIYLPFTIEANYNSEMTAYNIPFTVCHELSHLRGFMQEEEANFIAWLACMNSDEDDFQYSGRLMGWIYCMNALRKADPKAWEEVRGELAPEVEPDLKANSEFWAKYDGAVAEVSNRINDTYLKVNGQNDGVKSYDRMVDLVVEFYKEGLLWKVEN